MNEYYTSAGVYNSGGQLVRHLWSFNRYFPGQSEVFWDGYDDHGFLLTSPAASGTLISGYSAKIVYHNVWAKAEGLIGCNAEPFYEYQPKAVFQPILSMCCAASTPIKTFWSVSYNELGCTFFYLKDQESKIELDAYKRVFKGPLYAEGSHVFAGNYQANLQSICTDDQYVYWADYDDDTPWLIIRTDLEPDLTSDADLGTAPWTNTSPGPSGTQVYNGTFRGWPNPLTLNQVGSAISIGGMCAQRNGGNLLLAGINRIANSPLVPLVSSLGGNIFGFNKTNGTESTTFTSISVASVSAQWGKMCFDKSDDTVFWAVCSTPAGSNRNYSISRFVSGGSGWGITHTITNSADTTCSIVSINTDYSSNLYVAFAGYDCRIWQFDSNTEEFYPRFGQLSGYWMVPTVSTNRFDFNSGPYGAPGGGVDVDQSGNIWVADPGCGRILKFDSTFAYLDGLYYHHAGYLACVNTGNPSQIFKNFDEYEVNYSQPISSCWTFKNHWGPYVQLNWPLIRQTGIGVGVQQAFTVSGHNYIATEYNFPNDSTAHLTLFEIPTGASTTLRPCESLNAYNFEASNFYSINFPGGKNAVIGRDFAIRRIHATTDNVAIYGRNLLSLSSNPATGDANPVYASFASSTQSLSWNTTKTTRYPVSQSNLRAAGTDGGIELPGIDLTPLADGSHVINFGGWRVGRNITNITNTTPVTVFFNSDDLGSAFSDHASLCAGDLVNIQGAYDSSSVLMVDVNKTHRISQITRTYTPTPSTWIVLSGSACTGPALSLAQSSDVQFYPIEARVARMVPGNSAAWMSCYTKPWAQRPYRTSIDTHPFSVYDAIYYPNNQYGQSIFSVGGIQITDVTDGYDVPGIPYKSNLTRVLNPALSSINATGYHGEFWGGSQAGLIMLYHNETGLFLNFVGNRPMDKDGGPFPGTCGNAFSWYLTEANGQNYVYVNDESQAAGVTRHKIYNLSSIQTITVALSAKSQDNTKASKTPVAGQHYLTYRCVDGSGRSREDNLSASNPKKIVVDGLEFEGWYDVCKDFNAKKWPASYVGPYSLWLHYNYLCLKGMSDIIIERGDDYGQLYSAWWDTFFMSGLTPSDTSADNKFILMYLEIPTGIYNCRFYTANNDNIQVANNDVGSLLTTTLTTAATISAARGALSTFAGNIGGGTSNPYYYLPDYRTVSGVIPLTSFNGKMSFKLYSVGNDFSLFGVSLSAQ